MAPAGLSFLYLGEFVGDRKRTAFSQAMGTMWIASWIVLPGEPGVASAEDHHAKSGFKRLIVWLRRQAWPGW